MKPTGKKKAMKKAIPEKVSADYCQNGELYKKPICTLGKLLQRGDIPTSNIKRIISGCED